VVFDSRCFQVLRDSGSDPAVMGIERRNSKESTSSLRTFITDSPVIRDVTLLASGPCH